MFILMKIGPSDSHDKTRPRMLKLSSDCYTFMVDL